jgi:hypothetical protein
VYNTTYRRAAAKRFVMYVSKTVSSVKCKMTSSEIARSAGKQSSVVHEAGTIIKVEALGQIAGESVPA